MMPDGEHQATFSLSGLHLPWKTTTVTILSTLLLTVDHYYKPIPILFLAGCAPALMSYYARYNQPPGEVVLTAALELFGWGFFFRGFMLFALYCVAGPSAIVLQAVPFALAHLGKPPLETFTTIPGGTAFGWVTRRTR